MPANVFWAIVIIAAAAIIAGSIAAEIRKRARNRPEK